MLPRWLTFLFDCSFLLALVCVTSGQVAPGYWPRYSGHRKVVLLDGLWNTSRLENPSGFDSMDPNLDPSQISTPNITEVPSTVDNTLPGYLGYRGVSFFRTTFSSSGPARIQFQACSFYCRIWVNNAEIGDHRAGGYVAFSLPVNLPAQDHSVELFVLVDNRFNHTTAPVHTGGDFWHYGGILRSVEWHFLSSKVGPWRLFVFPQSDLQSVRIQLQLTDFDHVGILNDDVNLWFDDSKNSTIVLPAGSLTTYTSRKYLDLGLVQVPNPRIWSPTDPQLHTISVELHGAIVTERFGLRYWNIGEDSHGASRIQLNGEILKLVGWNHHTQWPDTAASPTDEQLDDDIILLQQGNANFVRGAHYPQDPRWLDRLDEVGMVMWCETLGPGVSVENLQDEYFLTHQEQQMKEMLDSAMNHASIAFWAFFNEGPSSKADACPGYQASSDIIRSIDSTRFITYASNTYPPKDLCYDAATVISHNGYPGWYQSVAPAPWWNRIANDLQAGKPSNAKGKPFIISETGAAGIYEWVNSTTNNTHTKWTIPYQTSIIQQDVDTALSNSNISGICLWHFFDFKVNDKWENNTHCDYLPDVEPPTCGYIAVNTSSASGRPGGANHKGVLDFFRRPKPAYAMVAAKYAHVTKYQNMNSAEMIHQTEKIDR